MDRNQPTSALFSDLANDTLPQVSWVLPDLRNSEHPAHGSMQPGQTHVTKVINAIGVEACGKRLLYNVLCGTQRNYEVALETSSGTGCDVASLITSPVSASNTAHGNR